MEYFPFDVRLVIWKSWKIVIVQFFFLFSNYIILYIISVYWGNHIKKKIPKYLVPKIPFLKKKNNKLIYKE